MVQKVSKIRYLEHYDPAEFGVRNRGCMVRKLQHCPIEVSDAHTLLEPHTVSSPMKAALFIVPSKEDQGNQITTFEHGPDKD
jgi:hypothetical protein